eukprot:16091-Prorocentrum_minimum.AAC.2
MLRAPLLTLKGRVRRRYAAGECTPESHPAHPAQAALLRPHDFQREPLLQHTRPRLRPPPEGVQRDHQPVRGKHLPGRDFQRQRGQLPAVAAAEHRRGRGVEGGVQEDRLRRQLPRAQAGARPPEPPS